MRDVTRDKLFSSGWKIARIVRHVLKSQPSISIDILIVSRGATHDEDEKKRTRDSVEEEEEAKNKTCTETKRGEKKIGSK